MANSRLLQMYGFAEAENPHDDVHIQKSVILKVLKANNIEAFDAKVKMLDSMGFFDEGILQEKLIELNFFFDF